MTKVIAGITTSVDGYITGPDDGPGRGLGVGGERLHYWVFGGPWSYHCRILRSGEVPHRDEYVRPLQLDESGQTPLTAALRQRFGQELEGLGVAVLLVAHLAEEKERLRAHGPGGHGGNDRFEQLLRAVKVASAGMVLSSFYRAPRDPVRVVRRRQAACPLGKLGGRLGRTARTCVQGGAIQ